jgi:fatty acid amide hydrolase
MPVIELTKLSAGELARLIARCEISSTDTVNAFIARIEQVNPKINAVVVPLFEPARAAARRADDRLAKAERPIGPLHGVPITVKESFHVAGTPCSIGLTHRTQRRPADGILIQRLRDAGAIILGKTNVSQLMFWHESDNPVYGRSNNPWDLERSAGGSTGGEAAIIAAGGSPLGLGSDLGGSIRVPAHFCGIHGIKPTSCRLPRTGSATNLHGMEAFTFQPGPMARSVDDLVLALNVLAGSAEHSTDYDVTPAPLRQPRDVELSQLRIAVWLGSDDLPPSPAIRRVVAQAGQVLRQRGATIVDYRFPDFEDAIQLYYALASADGGADARRLLRGSRVDWRLHRLVRLAGMPYFCRCLVAAGLRIAGQPTFAKLVSAARSRSADQYWRLTHHLTQYIRRVAEQWTAQRIDAVLLPPHALPAMQHGKAIDLIPAASYAFITNLLGLPGGVVSLSRVRDGEESDRQPCRDIVIRRAIEVETGSTGLPVGVQVAARHWREDVVLAIMAALEHDLKDDPSFPSIPPI